MAQLTLDQKREITSRLGYRLIERAGDDRRDLFGPDGRHRAIFRPSKAADLWIWNDAVFSFELYADRDGAVLRRLPSPLESPLLESVWPAKGEPQELSAEALSQNFERLSGSQSI